MKILVIGCGKVGGNLIPTLCSENHDVTIVDTNKRNIEELTGKYDVIGVIGNGASKSILNQAGVSDTDIVMAMTGNDEINMMCCLLAKKLGGCRTIARIHNPEYDDNLNIFKEELGLAMTVNPELMAAEETSRVIVRLPSAQKIETFAKGRVELLKYKLPAGSELSGVRVSDIPKKYKVKVLIGVVERGDDVIIPNGDFVMQEGDILSVISTRDNKLAIFNKNIMSKRKVSKCMIAGGGGVAYYLARDLLKSGVRVTIIDKSLERCRFLSENLEGAMVINADAVDTAALEEEGLREMDAFIAMTNIDETNLLLSLYAKNNSTAKLVTKVHRVSYDDIIRSFDLDTIICPKNIVSDNILSYVRAMQNSQGSNIETLYRIIGDKAEAIEFAVRGDCPVIGKTLMEMEIKPDIVVAAIIHGTKVEIPSGESVISAGDNVVVVTTRSNLKDVSDILK
ncbi:MAG: Trk system potassium transporter TrkA [Eubacterium sp.]|nr:Trk system potassium transporter TrkA [Eubacterium sp.]